VVNQLYVELLDVDNDGYNDLESKTILGMLVQTLETSRVIPVMTKPDDLTCTAWELERKLNKSNQFRVYFLTHPDARFFNNPESPQFLREADPKDFFKPYWNWFWDLGKDEWKPKLPDIPGHVKLHLERQAAK
jgi:hypothetical protein